MVPLWTGPKQVAAKRVAKKDLCMFQEPKSPGPMWIHRLLRISTESRQQLLFTFLHSKILGFILLVLIQNIGANPGYNDNHSWIYRSKPL